MLFVNSVPYIEYEMFCFAVTKARCDFQKFHDPNAAALNAGRSMLVEVFVPRITSLIERSAARAIGETEIGANVTIQEVKPVAVSTPAKK